MRRVWLAIVFSILAVGGITLAQHGEHKKGVIILSQTDIIEKIDGKKSKATMVLVTLAPGEASAPHHHPGPALGYVLEGEYEWALDDNPVKTLKPGDTFYEPTGCLHRVSRNPSKNNTTRIVATVLHSADVKDIVIPAKDKKPAK
jgi:quercetin dioxygenase-like cupin family protein